MIKLKVYFYKKESKGYQYLYKIDNPQIYYFVHRLVLMKNN
jgi:hypothetical protein